MRDLLIDLTSHKLIAASPRATLTIDAFDAGGFRIAIHNDSHTSAETMIIETAEDLDTLADAIFRLAQTAGRTRPRNPKPNTDTLTT